MLFCSVDMNNFFERNSWNGNDFISILCWMEMILFKCLKFYLELLVEPYVYGDSGFLHKSDFRFGCHTACICVLPCYGIESSRP